MTEVLGNDDTNYTLQRDATTKKGHHYYANQLATKDKTLTIGITYVSCVKEKLSDIDSSSNSSTILNKVSNFMTNKRSTEEKVNKILNESSSQEWNSFKCSVHPLLQFSDTCKKELTVMEQELKIKDIDDQTKEIYSATENLLRSVSKLFFKDGAGDPLYVPTYSKDKGINTIPVISFRGNRFNTLFHNAPGTYYLRDILIQYFTASKCSLHYR